ncbi:hypothetical protein EC973_000004 [Apophysomyces ossiformis]|uniref:Uncharacterized protein n=1 Tax=Apophysomyces ossiformis TaxID=679940 RepID=A0A8H7BTV2_9FUNG|nr:hypothetical protein EC973_000004 [Apophysomyces ossiformis]
MQLSDFSAEQKEVFTEFRGHQWDNDTSFRIGLENIMKQMEGKQNDRDQVEARILEAKHFYFSKTKKPFELRQYIEYEKALEEQTRKDQIAQFERLEEYDFDNDEAYLAGLPNVIQGWIDGKGRGWSTEHLENEFTKLKAFYYAKCVENVDIAAYLKWRKRKETPAASACPFAHTWNRRGKGGNAQLPTSSNFVSTEKSHGAFVATLSGQSSFNALTVSRLLEVKEALEAAQDDHSITSLLIMPTVVETEKPEPVDTINQRIRSKDTKIVSKGLAYEETAALVADKPELIQASQQKLADTYYELVRSVINHSQKPMAMFLNGGIPIHASYLSLWVGYMRVITENVVVDFGLKPGHAPVPPLLLLSLSRTLAEKKLPAGIDLYLALAPSDLTKLRGPELLRLGLADTFVPESRLNDAYKDIKRMTVCKGSQTNKAFGFVASIYHTYAGPDKLEVWKENIETIFGAAETFEDLLERLKSKNDYWSKTILSHWDALPPNLLKATMTRRDGARNVVFKAVQESRNLREVGKVLQLESNLNAKWRQTDDYRRWIENKMDWTGRLEEPDEQAIRFYFEEDLIPNEGIPVIYDAPAEKPKEVAVCPVTGQKGALACPVSGQVALEAATAVCPVTGQRSSQEATCPVTAQTSTEQGATTCPVTGQKSISGCPVMGH